MAVGGGAAFMGGGFYTHTSYAGVPAWVTGLDANAGWAIDFAGGRKFRADFSATRASTKFALNAAGVYLPFAVDAPAVTDRGISIEPARTNTVSNNVGDSGTGIILTGTTRVATAAGDSPANDNNGKLITQGAGASDSMTFGTFTNLISAGSRHAVSVDFAYTGSARYLRIVLSDNVSFVNNCWVDLLAGTVSNLSTGASAELIATAWGYRLEFVTGAYPNTTANSQMQVIAVAGLGNTTRAAGNYKMWGGQVEKDQVTATSPILTSGATATRAADNVLVDMPAGTFDAHVIFDNDSTQVVAGIADNWAIPTNLNRRTVKAIYGLSA